MQNIRRTIFIDTLPIIVAVASIVIEEFNDRNYIVLINLDISNCSKMMKLVSS